MYFLKSVILKNVKYIKKLKEQNSEYLYTFHLDSPFDHILHICFFCVCFFLSHFKISCNVELLLYT